MKSSFWQIPLLIIVLTVGTAREFTSHSQLVLAQSARSQKQEAERLVKSGVEEYQLKNFPRALELLQKALSLFRTIPDRKEEAATLSLIGLVYSDSGDYKRSVESYQQALVIFKRVDDRDLESQVISRLGKAYQMLGQYQQAIEYYQQALIINRELRDREGESNSLNNLGIIYNKLGKYEKAIGIYQQSLKISKSSGIRSEQATSFNNLGAVYNNLGQYRKASEFYQQSLVINRELNDAYGITATLNNLGLVYDNLGSYQTAIESYQQSLVIIKRLKNRTAESYVFNNLGAIYKKIGLYQRSIEYFQQSLSISKELGGNIENESAILNNLGSIYHDAGEYQQALAYYQQALATSQKLGNRSGEGSILNNLGVVYMDLGQHLQAIAYYQQALKIREAIVDVGGQLNTLNNIGTAYDNVEQYSRANDFYDRALKIRNYLITNKESVNPNEELIIFSNLGRIAYISNNLDISRQYFEKSVLISDRLVTNNLGDRERIALFNKQLNTYKALSLVQHRQNKSSESLTTSERGRTRAFQALFAQKQNLKSTNPTFTQLQFIARKNQSTIVEYSIIPRFGKTDPRAQDELFIYVITPDGKLTVRIQPLSAATDLSKLVASNRARMLNDPSNIASRRGQNLGANSTLYEKQPVKVQGDALADPSRQIIKIDRVKNEVEVTGLAGGTTDIVPIDRIITLNRPINARYDSLQKLHKLLIAPIADLLPKNPNSSVIFIPDGALFEVPFAALQDAEGKYLIDKHPVLTAPSLGVLTQTSQIQPQGNQALVIGNPSMPKPRKVYGETQLSPLPFSEAEARQIAKLYPAKLLIGAAATKKAVKDKLSSYRVIHLSTHGILNQKIVGESAIALAPGDGDDGYLTVNEILDFKLNADLVVLSACDTGRGEISGDGVLGLSRALMTAGSRSLIVSLWSVNDESTSELMQEFYRQWQNGKKSKAVALREAMLAVREKYPAPYHWAGMTLMGEDK